MHGKVCDIACMHLLYIINVTLKLAKAFVILRLFKGNIITHVPKGLISL